MAKKADKMDFAEAAILALNAKKLAKKQQRKRQKILLIELFVDFAKNTTLHGLKYINERGISALEKGFWFITFAVSVGLCGYLIGNVWHKWQTSPVIVTFSDQMMPVGMVPFPSVTICPQLKSMVSAYNYSAEKEIYDKLLHSKKKLSAKNITSANEFEQVSIVCHEGRFRVLPKLEKENDNYTLVEKLLKVASPKKRIKCTWRDTSCNHLMRTVLTHEGVCYNFNSLSAEEIFNTETIQKDYAYMDGNHTRSGWDAEQGYSNDDTEPYPKRGRASEATPDLDFLLEEVTAEKDGLCNSLSRGYKIYIQHPMDKPESSVYYYAALPGQVSSIALKFTMMSTAAGLSRYSPEVRKCYFPSDRQLYYFKLYTQNNCRLECRSNFIFKKCGCVWYNLPHNDSQRICTIRQRQCVMDAYDELSDREMQAALGTRSQACHCLPACNSVMYEAEILKTDFDVLHYLSSLYKMDVSRLNRSSYSKIQIYFKEPQFMSMHRSELFGVTDFLANCGGLLGLFLGFSFLSLVEIFYFITLRFCCILRRDMKQNKTTVAIIN